MGLAPFKYGVRISTLSSEYLVANAYIGFALTRITKRVAIAIRMFTQPEPSEQNKKE